MMTLLQLQVLNWRSLLTSFQPTSLHCYFTFLLINDVRMTTFTHQLLSRKTSTPEVWQCECEYSSRSATCPSLCCARAMQKSFLAERTNGRAYATVLRLSLCLSVCPSSVTLYIVAKRCVLEQKLLLRAYRKSYMRNRLVPKWMTLTFV